MTINVGPADAGSLPICSHCGRSSTAEARFCAYCGSPSLVAPFTAMPATAAEAGYQEATAAPAPAAGRRGRSRTLIATATVLGLLVAGAGITVALLDSPAEKQLSASNSLLVGALAALSAADSTADLRAAGQSVDPAAAQAEAFLAAQSAQDRSAALTDTTEALRAVAELSTVAGDETAPWKASEPVIRDLATSTDESVASLGPASAAAADHVDGLVKAARADYKIWAADNAEQVAHRDAAITQATTYQARVGEYLEEYSGLREELNTYIEKVETVGSTMDEAYAEFSDAAQSRRAVRDGLAALTPPTEAARAHTRLLSVLADGISAVEAAERALDVSDCGIYGCNVFDQPAWAEFRDESKRISSSFGEATDDVHQTAQEAVDAAKAIQIPNKPEF